MYLIKDTVSGKYLDGTIGAATGKGKLTLVPPSEGTVRALMFSDIFSAGKVLQRYNSQRTIELNNIDKKIAFTRRCIAQTKERLAEATEILKDLENTQSISKETLIGRIKKLTKERDLDIDQLLQLTRSLNRIVNQDVDDEDGEWGNEVEEIREDILEYNKKIEWLLSDITMFEGIKKEIQSEKASNRLDVVYASEEEISRGNE